MARLHSSLGDRTVYTAAGLAKAQGYAAKVYEDPAGTVLANLAVYVPTSPAVPGAAIPGAALVVDPWSNRPAFWDLNDREALYISVAGPTGIPGPLEPIRPDAQPLVTALATRVTTVEDTAAAAETPAGAQAKASAAQAAAIAAVAGTGPLRAVDGRNYRMVLGVIRNNGSPSYWQALDDDGFHRPHNIDSVTTDTATIVVNYASLGATRIASLVVVPDETLGAAGIIAGSSVTATAATITLSRPGGLADYVSYNGTSWVSQNGVFTGLSFAAGVLSLTHPSMEDPANPFVGFFGVSVTGRGSALVPLISTDSGGLSNTGLKVSWFDWAGTLQTAASTGMKAFITRSAPKAQTVNPQTVDTTKFPSSNLWIIGVFEVAAP